MNPYPKNQSLQDTLDYIISERENDVKDFDNLRNLFISGRKGVRIPVSATDILPSDQLGDFNYDSQYAYLVVQNALGNNEWRRIALGVW